MSGFLILADRLSRLAETLAVVMIFGYCALMLAEVVARSQAQSLSYSWEFSQYAMAAIFALASGPAIRSATHVRISLLSEHLPVRLEKWLDIIANAVSIIIVALIVWAMWVKVGTSIERNIVATTVTRTPLWIPQLFVLWGFAQLLIDLLARLVRRCTDQRYEWQQIDSDLYDV